MLEMLNKLNELVNSIDKLAKPRSQQEFASQPIEDYPSTLQHEFLDTNFEVVEPLSLQHNFPQNQSHKDEKEFLNENESLGDCTYLMKKEFPVNSKPIFEQDPSPLVATEEELSSHISPIPIFNQESHLELELHVFPISFEVLKEFKCVVYEEDENSIILESLDKLEHDKKENFERNEKISSEKPFSENIDQIERFFQILSKIMNIEQKSVSNENPKTRFCIRRT